MATHTRDQLEGLARDYFEALGDKDLDRMLSYFADDAEVTVLADGATLGGTSDIQSMFTDFFDRSASISHELDAIVIDEGAGRITTVQRYMGELTSGTRNDMRNCNVFEVGEDGRITRVLIWTGGDNALNTPSG